ncbi:hypothetical protein DH86_00001954 [Scytalidium sp. 3C]|nr:hypothetical protein DH86_00001954 [Scytalidium sp. 3C]
MADTDKDREKEKEKEREKPTMKDKVREKAGMSSPGGGDEDIYSGAGETSSRIGSRAEAPVMPEGFMFRPARRREAGDGGDDAEVLSLHAAEEHIDNLSRKAEQGANAEGNAATLAEVERLRAAMNAQLQLNQYRAKLAKHLGEREERASATGPPPVPGTARVSPIDEESRSNSPPRETVTSSPADPLATASSDSNQTLRGGMTPGLQTSRTPSYPFPPMRLGRQFSHGGHRPFTVLSPTTAPANYHGYAGHFAPNPYDRVLSASNTPGSTINFQPPGASPNEDPLYPTPNLYDLSLMLSGEPGLDAWWTTVSQIMRDIYKAERVTLSVPADPTDLENVPWGQKATFDVAHEDEYSLAYLPRGSSLVPSSTDTFDTSISGGTNIDLPEELAPPPPAKPAASEVRRPGLVSRHSYTAYENTKREHHDVAEPPRTPAARPTALSRSKSYFAGVQDPAPRSGTLRNAQLNLQLLQERTEQEEQENDPWAVIDPLARKEVRGRVFPVLQALDYETDPLIDACGVIRVLERGKVITLTRTYPYLDNPLDEPAGKSKPIQRNAPAKAKDATEKGKKPKHPGIGSRASSLFGSDSTRKSSWRGKSRTATLDESPPMPVPLYEEYEQTPASPWQQSPAPSPAVRAETSDNPFFANATVDEETFDPKDAPQDYSQVQQVEAIGVDHSWTVLHVPLIHPLLSKPVPEFRLDPSAIELKQTGARGKGEGPESVPRSPHHGNHGEDRTDRRTPIAILSILSTVIPYPSNLRHSLEHLAPHLATSFSLCRHYTNLETEMQGLSRKRPQTAGFGAVAADGRRVEDEATLASLRYFAPGERPRRPSQGAGSLTSPSDYSAVSRSAAGSPAVTPGWDASGTGLGLSMDKRSSGAVSPMFTGGESYFATKGRRSDAESASSSRSARPHSKESTPPDNLKQSPASQAEEKMAQEEQNAPEKPSDVGRKSLEFEKRSSTRESRHEAVEPREPSPNRRTVDRRAVSHGITGATTGQSKIERPHTQLHSYGADFGATFQSLPNTSTPLGAVPSSARPTTRRELGTSPTVMPPPSDRLKGLMLDSLPAHVFVALPQSGEIVWVNSRYLTYRGQTVQELYKDPWSSLHPDDRDEYLKAWSYSLRTGEQFSVQVRIRRFDGNYRWFYTRAVGSRDTRGVIVQWYGSHMDIHDQHIAELKAARQEEIEASEAKHRLLANLIPQIIFAATEDDGVTFANEQWLSYTGQEFNDALGLGFMDYVHPDDLAKCKIPFDRMPAPSQRRSSQDSRNHKASIVSETPTEKTVRGIYESLSRNNSSSSGSVYEFPTADLAELARTGVVKVTTDNDGRLSYHTEVRLRSKTGEYRWHLVSCVEVDNINFGSGDGSWFGACTDINDHKLLESKLKEAMDSKSKFLSNMSHEIRTPLIGISGMVSFLQDTVLNDEQLDYTNTIQTSAKSLLDIINDILDLSKVDAGMMKLSYEWFHPRSLVEEVNEAVSTMAITKRLELNYVVEVDVPEMVKGDKVRIKQVLLNVIGNAIKFTTVGEVFSRCRVYREENPTIGENEIMLEYSIIDTGSGFTQEEADLIFKPFSQIDGSSTRQHGGSGLGLVISRQLVELHGGKMEGSAIPGVGSTFTFTAKFGLPTPDDHPDITPTKASSSRSASVSLLSSPTPVNSSSTQRFTTSNAILQSNLVRSPAIDSPLTDASNNSPAVMSSGSSAPSVTSGRSQTTKRSSISSLSQSYAPFGEAARRSGQDVADMNLELPNKNGPLASTSEETVIEDKPASSVTSPASTSKAASRETSPTASDAKQFRPPMYSILLVCPQKHSREATKHHIEVMLPQDVPHQITTLASADEARALMAGEDPIIFSHIVLNLPSAEDLVSLIDQIVTTPSFPRTSILVLSDPVQRQEVLKLARAQDFNKLTNNSRITFIYKPVKPSRFAVIFDPEKERDLSKDRNRSRAEMHIANQKQNYLEIEKRLGNRGLRVLLVEDNLVNQKVLLRFLGKVGITVELALDGVDCVEKVFSKDHGFYSIILLDPKPTMASTGSGSR